MKVRVTACGLSKNRLKASWLAESYAFRSKTIIKVRQLFQFFFQKPIEKSDNCFSFSFKNRHKACHCFRSNTIKKPLAASVSLTDNINVSVNSCFCWKQLGFIATFLFSRPPNTNSVLLWFSLISFSNLSHRYMLVKYTWRIYIDFISETYRRSPGMIFPLYTFFKYTVDLSCFSRESSVLVQFNGGENVHESPSNIFEVDAVWNLKRENHTECKFLPSMLGREWRSDLIF